MLPLLRGWIMRMPLEERGELRLNRGGYDIADWGERAQGAVPLVAR